MQQHFDTENVILPILEVLSAGQLQVRKASIPMPLEEHENAFELLHLTSGLKTMYADGRAFHMRGGDMLLLHPDEKHGNPDEVQNRSAMQYIIFRDPASTRGFLDMSKAERDLLGRLLRRCRMFRPDTALLAAFNACFAAAWGEDLLFATRLRSSLFLLLDMIALKHADLSERAVLPDDVARVLALIHQHDDQRITVEAMAQAAYLSVPYFKQKFKRAMGVPPAEYLIRSRIAKACQALEETDQSITEIAMHLGFSSSQHFAAIFKRYTGFTPRDFRYTGSEH